ncbi:MAG TPA: VOC family protein [Caulobacteraceae bacterium]|nr:VOC family protein [Caulobacteraceae bacterium]
MLGHISFGVRDLGRSIRFYDAVLGALGYVRLVSSDHVAGYGVRGASNERFAIMRHPEAGPPPGPGFHLAFAAPSREAVDAFHAAALRFGGVDDGAPGLRPQYGPGYYAAFVLDPDGHKLEAKHPPPEG